MRHHQRGFSYVALLMLVAIVGMAAASTTHVGALMQRRAAEEQLLFVGGELQRALLSYATSTPVGASRYPKKIEDLLRDPRHPGIRRHLRQTYADPITGRAEWGTVRSPDGGIAAFHSLSGAAPIKQQGFDAGFEHLAGRRRYDEWVFGNDQRGDLPLVKRAWPESPAPHATPARDRAPAR